MGLALQAIFAPDTVILDDRASEFQDWSRDDPDPNAVPILDCLPKDRNGSNAGDASGAAETPAAAPPRQRKPIWPNPRPRTVTIQAGLFEASSPVALGAGPSPGAKISGIAVSGYSSDAPSYPPPWNFQQWHNDSVGGPGYTYLPFVAWEIGDVPDATGQPGEPWNFTSWHRDSVGGAAVANFSP